MEFCEEIFYQLSYGKINYTAVIFYKKLTGREFVSEESQMKSLNLETILKKKAIGEPGNEWSNNEKIYYET